MTIEEDTQRSVPYVLGIDIHPMTSPKGRSRSRKAQYAAVCINEQGIISKKYNRLDFSSLVNILQNTRPRYLAVDNLFEIAKNAREVVSQAGRIPDSVSIVQTTGSPKTGFEKLLELARKHLSEKEVDFSLKGKLNPIQAAEVSARLVLAGIGHIISVFEEEIRLSVTRNKSPGPGGWSQARYARNLGIAVSATTKALKEALRAKSIQYDFFRYPRKSVFLVPTSQQGFSYLFRIAKDLSGELARVNVERVPKESLDFIPLTGEISVGIVVRRSIVVGIDPGTTTGIAIIEAKSGRVLHFSSRRELGFARIIRIFTKYGRTVVVATDVRPAPKIVQKVARSLGARIIVPRNPQTPTAEKREYLREKGFEGTRLDSHERAALFASLHAYNQVRRQIEKAKTAVNEGMPTLLPYIDDVIRLVLLGKTVSQAIEEISDSIMRTRDQKFPEVVEKQPETYSSQEYERLLIKIQSQASKIEELNEEIQQSQERAEEQKEELREYKDLYNHTKRKKSLKIDRDKRIREKGDELRRVRTSLREQKRENAVLLEKIGRLRSFRAIWQRGELIPLKTVEKLIEAEIETTHGSLGLNEGDIVLLLDPSGGGARTAKFLSSFGIRAVILPKTPSTPRIPHIAEEAFENEGIPILSFPIEEFEDRKELPGGPWISEMDGIYLIDRPTLEREILIEEARLINKKRRETRKRQIEQEKQKDEEHEKTSELHSPLDLNLLLREYKDQFRTLEEE